jgi:uroporphyrinogen-III synthase
MRPAPALATGASDGGEATGAAALATAMLPSTAAAKAAATARRRGRRATSPSLALRRLPCSAAGATARSSTLAKVALARGLPAPAVVAEDVAKLAATLREAGDSFRNVLYLAGQDRKPDLESACEAMGLTVRTAVLYEALAAQELSVEARAALISGSLEGVLHFSRRSAALFLSLADEASLADRIGRPLIHWCLSWDVARPLAARGLQTRIAQKPDAAALFDLIETG